MKITQKQQDNYLYDMKRLIDKIRDARFYTGDDPENHEEIWLKISELYNKLDSRRQDEFNCYVN